MGMFDFWDSNDSGYVVPYASQALDNERFAWDTGVASSMQSPETTAPAASSWLGAGALPQVINDASAAIKAGIGLSLAKDNLQYQRQANQIGLDIARTNALTDQARAQAVLGAQNNANRIAQQYPFGVPFGKTRNDQMLLIAAAVAVAFLAMNKRAK